MVQRSRPRSNSRFDDSVESTPAVVGKPHENFSLLGRNGGVHTVLDLLTDDALLGGRSDPSGVPRQAVARAPPLDLPLLGRALWRVIDGGTCPNIGAGCCGSWRRCFGHRQAGVPQVIAMVWTCLVGPSFPPALFVVAGSFEGVSACPRDLGCLMFMQNSLQRLAGCGKRVL